MGYRLVTVLGGDAGAIGSRSGEGEEGPEPGGHSGDPSSHVTRLDVFSLIPGGITPCRSTNRDHKEARNRMSNLWIILIVILVLALLGFFSRGRW